MNGITVSTVPGGFVGPIPGEIMVEGLSDVVRRIHLTHPRGRRLGTSVGDNLVLVYMTVGHNHVPVCIDVVSDLRRATLQRFLKRLFGWDELAQRVTNAYFGSDEPQLISFDPKRYFRVNGVADAIDAKCNSMFGTTFLLDDAAIEAMRVELHGLRGSVKGRQRQQLLEAGIAAFEKRWG